MSPPPDLSDLSDQDVAAWARQGHEAAYRELLRRYEGTVHQLLYHLVHDEELAKDLAQETFLRVHTSLDTYRPEFRFSSWVLKIANNLGVDYLRRRQLDTLSLDGSPFADTPRSIEATALQVARSDPTPTPTPQPDARERAAAIREAIRRLRGNYRRCFELRHIDGRSYDSIGEILDLPPTTVKTYVHRAKHQLIEMLGPLPDASRKRSPGGHPPIA